MDLSRCIVNKKTSNILKDPKRIKNNKFQMNKSNMRINNILQLNVIMHLLNNHFKSKTSAVIKATTLTKKVKKKSPKKEQKKIYRMLRMNIA